MAYSIYYSLKPKILETIDVYPVFSAWFEANPWARKPEFSNDGTLMGYSKPRGDKSLEQSLFTDLNNARINGLLESVSADEWTTEPPLESKLAAFPELIKMITEG